MFNIFNQEIHQNSTHDIQRKPGCHLIVSDRNMGMFIPKPCIVRILKQFTGAAAAQSDHFAAPKLCISRRLNQFLRLSVQR